METAKLFQNGRSQAVRLPHKFRFSGDEVFIQQIGEAVLLVPKDDVWKTFLNGLHSFSDDFFADGRDVREFARVPGLQIENWAQTTDIQETSS